MLTIIFIILFGGLLLYFFTTIYLVMKRGDEWYLIPFLICYLPVYITLQSLAFQQTGSTVLVSIIQYLKELILLVGMGCFIFYKRDIFGYQFNLRSTDYIFIAFLLLGASFMFLPIGSASFFSKAVYFKNMLIMGLMYFLGRNMVLSDERKKTILKMVLGVGAFAFLLGLGEYLTNTHYHSVVGYGSFNDLVHEIEPSGHYGLSWTFETQLGAKRFGSFFANPLELASACLLTFATAFILFMKTPHRDNQIFYFLAMCMIVCTMLFAYSRASIAAFFLQLFFIAVLFRYYRLLLTGFGLFVLGVIYIFYFASDDLYYFVIDTITFQNASSFGHLVEWVEGFESMVESPQGIGLAMSGNASGVDTENKVGGENQFLIYGVQIGLIGLLLYIFLLASSIRTAMKAYNLSIRPIDSLIPFIAAAVKFALLLPLFTANAELYLLVSYISWWMVGHSVQIYNRQLAKKIAYG